MFHYCQIRLIFLCFGVLLFEAHCGPSYFFFQLSFLFGGGGGCSVVLVFLLLFFFCPKRGRERGGYIAPVTYQFFLYFYNKRKHVSLNTLFMWMLQADVLFVLTISTFFHVFHVDFMVLLAILS